MWTKHHWWPNEVWLFPPETRHLYFNKESLLRIPVWWSIPLKFCAIKSILLQASSQIYLVIDTNETPLSKRRGIIPSILSSHSSLIREDNTHISPLPINSKLYLRSSFYPIYHKGNYIETFLLWWQRNFGTLLMKKKDIQTYEFKTYIDRRKMH